MWWWLVLSGLVFGPQIQAGPSIHSQDDIILRHLVTRPRFSSRLGSFRTLALLYLLKSRYNPRTQELRQRLDEIQRTLDAIKASFAQPGQNSPPLGNINDPPNDDPKPPGDKAKGEVLAKQCTDCHSQKTGRTAEQIKAAIDTIPPMGTFSTLTDAEIEDIAAYLAN